MKSLIDKSSGYNRVEFWGVATIFGLLIFLLVTQGDERSLPYINMFERAGQRFSFYPNFFTPILLRYTVYFLSFLFLNYWLVPKLIAKENVFRNVMILLLLICLCTIFTGITDTYLRRDLYAALDHDGVNAVLLRRGFSHTIGLLVIFGVYTLVKYSSIYLLTNSESIHSRFPLINREGIIAFVVFMIGLLLMLIADDSEKAVLLAYMLLGLSGILIFLLASHRLIPRSLPKKYPFFSYLMKSIGVLLLAYFPVYILAVLFVYDDDAAFNVSFLNTLFQAFITVPLAWVVYRRKQKGNEEVITLKKELGRTNASFDFLRSQINPHFLFNALNTIYGTALQENAERTGEGIQKLGDMMRFMLQENMQEKISLAREIDYLNNYISLQRLRTDINPNITIETNIADEVYAVQIAPMLLIPFVENAFKHGISFREPSYIRITLEVRNKTLNFDVMNTKHPRPDNDPEKGKSGIGLNNVKQRLQLLYKKNHELIIRETGKDFFVHLTLQLS